jgi:hypothetical protein
MRFGGAGCCGGGGGHYTGRRSFLTKEERLAMLKEYKDDLEKEIKGVEESISELTAAAE